MAINFGSISAAAKNVCFNVPQTNPLKTSFLPPVSPIGKITLPNFLNKAVNFGKKLEQNLANIKLPPIKAKDLNVSVNFGGGNLAKAIGNLKVPTTFCITLGGGLGIDSIYSQIGGLMNQLSSPLINIHIPTVPNLDLASIIPPLFVDIKLPININLTQALDIVKGNCLASILDALKGLDPLERLRQLLNLASELCSAAQFTKLKAVIDQIQQAQAELIHQALATITDPLTKIAKLVDMAVDAFNSGAYDLLEEISRLLNGVKFDALINFLQSIDPATAIAALIANIRQLVQLGNFAPIQQLLSAIQIMKSKLEGITQIPSQLLNAPQLALDAIQAQINNLLDVQDFLGLNKLLTDVQKLEDTIIDNLRQLSPGELLGFLPKLLQDALQRLDVSQYNQLIQEAGSKLCQDIASLIPQLPNVPQVDPASIVPSILQ